MKPKGYACGTVVLFMCVFVTYEPKNIENTNKTKTKTKQKTN